MSNSRRKRLSVVQDMVIDNPRVRLVDIARRVGVTKKTASKDLYDLGYTKVWARVIKDHRGNCIGFTVPRRVGDA